MGFKHDFMCKNISWNILFWVVAIADGCYDPEDETDLEDQTDLEDELESKRKKKCKFNFLTLQV